MTPGQEYEMIAARVREEEQEKHNKVIHQMQNEHIEIMHDTCAEYECKIDQLKKGTTLDKVMTAMKNAESPAMVQVIGLAFVADAIAEAGGIDLNKKVIQFNDKFGLGYQGKPRMLPKQLEILKIKHLQEEMVEYRKATEDKDLEGCFDALIDIVYVALGTAYMHGFPFNKGFERVHEANMLKKRAANKHNKRGSEFDVVKPVGWLTPYFGDLL